MYRRTNTIMTKSQFVSLWTAANGQHFCQIYSSIYFSEAKVRLSCIEYVVKIISPAFVIRSLLQAIIIDAYSLSLIYPI
jgi:hypothetical protein